MLTRSLRADLGVMISASHNPYRGQRHQAFRPGRLQAVGRNRGRHRGADRRRRVDLLARPSEIGRAKRIDDAQDRYIEYRQAHAAAKPALDGLQVVIDCANGAAYKVAPEALWELGAEVIPIGVDPNGFNINHDCGSTAPARLLAQGARDRADIGIALDGDADRVIIVDEKGQIIDGDQIMAVIADPGGGAAASRAAASSPRSCPISGWSAILQAQGLRWRAPRSATAMWSSICAQHGYNVGGEQSGHIVLSDYSTTGDGLIAALQVLAVVAPDGKPVSEVCHRFDPLPQILKNVRYANGGSRWRRTPCARHRRRAPRLGNGGRLVIRPSGTEPVIRVMAEGDDETLVDTVRLRHRARAHSDRTSGVEQNTLIAWASSLPRPGRQSGPFPPSRVERSGIDARTKSGHDE